MRATFNTYESGNEDGPVQVQTTGGTIMGSAETIEDAVSGAIDLIEDGVGSEYEIWDDTKRVASVAMNRRTSTIEASR